MSLFGQRESPSNIYGAGGSRTSSGHRERWAQVAKNKGKQVGALGSSGRPPPETPTTSRDTRSPAGGRASKAAEMHAATRQVNGRTAAPQAPKGSPHMAPLKPMAAQPPVQRLRGPQPPQRQRVAERRRRTKRRGSSRDGKNARILKRWRWTPCTSRSRGTKAQTRRGASGEDRLLAYNSRCRRRAMLVLPAARTFEASQAGTAEG